MIDHSDQNMTVTNSPITFLPRVQIVVTPPINIKWQPDIGIVSHSFFTLS